MFFLGRGTLKIKLNRRHESAKEPREDSIQLNTFPTQTKTRLEWATRDKQLGGYVPLGAPISSGSVYRARARIPVSFREGAYSMSVDTATLAQLAPGFTGRLLQPADAEYDDARRVHNGLVDKHPAIIARCRGVADVWMRSSWHARSSWKCPSVAVGTMWQVTPSSTTV